ncbi:hypothetical protein GE09DRAFT_210871 [Coniochaeta sp. 2T2.1]|nr:hypothetical protein GE09DRAFT_210871 [Coniochaeta sp. 2T2.1]
MGTGTRRNVQEASSPACSALLRRREGKARWRGENRSRSRWSAGKAGFKALPSENQEEIYSRPFEPRPPTAYLLPEARRVASLFPCVAPLHPGVGATERGRFSLADERWICRTTTLGSFVDALSSAGLFPLPHQEDYLGSARILYHNLVHEGSRIKSIHIPTYIEPLVQRTPLDMPRRSSPHSVCNPKKMLREKINAAFNEYTDFDIQDDHKAHMERQRQKSGLLEPDWDE